MLLRQKIKFITIIILISINNCYGQIKVDNSIQFVSDTIEKRQVFGLSYPNNLTNAVNVESYISGAINYYQIDSLVLDTVYLSNYLNRTDLLEGMIVNFVSNFINSGPLYISINENIPVILKRNYFDSLRPNDIELGLSYSIIYEGNYFQLTTPVNNKCPNGFTPVNEKYCIQTDEAPVVTNFYDAALYCQSNGYRVCSWGEWYYACQKSGLGLLNMTNNFEWVNENCNAAGSALNIGNGNCETSAPSSASTQLRRFRCCYSK